ncbi:MAG: redoxin domain-containing protein [Myxococcales bacterium]
MSEAPALGSVLADVSLLDVKGKTTTLSKVAGDRVLVLLVYEGASSKVAVRHLLDFRDATMAFDKLGARIAAVSPDDPAAAAFLKNERGLGFPLLCDPQKKALREWGLLEPTGEVRESLFILGRDRGIKSRALGEFPEADRMLTFIRRGGAKGKVRPETSATARVSTFFARAAAAIGHALRTPGVVR